MINYTSATSSTRQYSKTAAAGPATSSPFYVMSAFRGSISGWFQINTKNHILFTSKIIVTLSLAGEYCGDHGPRKTFIIVKWLFFGGNSLLEILWKNYHSIIICLAKHDDLSCKDRYSCTNLRRCQLNWLFTENFFFKKQTYLTCTSSNGRLKGISLETSSDEVYKKVVEN